MLRGIRLSDNKTLTALVLIDALTYSEREAHQRYGQLCVTLTQQIGTLVGDNSSMNMIHKGLDGMSDSLLVILEVTYTQSYMQVNKRKASILTSPYNILVKTSTHIYFNILLHLIC